MTKGEYRVGVFFNPSSNLLVDEIKRKAADLIDLIETIQTLNKAHPDPRYGPPDQNFEKHRLKSIAQQAIEEGAMWAVKAETKGDM